MGRVIARWDGSWWPSSLKLLLPLKGADFLVFQRAGWLGLSLAGS
jgi:hypothetical protein